MIVSIALALSALLLARAEGEYYSFLEIPQDSSAEQLTQAYLRLKDKDNPEKYPGDKEKAQNYVRLQRIYYLLNDKDMRGVYNQYDERGTIIYEKERVVKEDGSPRGKDIPLTATLTLEELYTGVKKRMKYYKNVLCNHCHGEGGEVEICPECGGHGMVIKKVTMGNGFTMQMQTTCSRCGGQGKVIALLDRH